ncbi:hypothetical protein ACFYO7_13155 [Nocardia salmonicida]|uniref:hypothetical protein n=1 Tax=Nocardia salmonicida TaxID=53431 RepID=UPI0036A045CF
MSRSPIGDLVAEHLRRVRMLRAEFEDERARLEAKGDELLAQARAAEQQAAAQQEPVTEPQPVIDIDAIRREEQLRDAMARAAAEQVRASTATSEIRAAEQQATAAEQHTPTNWSPRGGASSLEDDALREAREAIARSAAARRAAERVEPVDYDGYDQESEYFRGKNWFG